MSFVRWLISAVPRNPKRNGLLMRLYFHWQELFTPAGHAAFALMFFSMFAGIVPGFWAAWIFCGLDFIFFLTLVPSLFLTFKKNKVLVQDISVKPVYEGEKTVLSVRLTAQNKIDALSLGCFRMDSNLKCVEPECISLAESETAVLQCGLQTKYRGAYPISRVAALIPEVRGMLRCALHLGTAELLVFPRPVRVGAFPFLTSGASGLVFAPLLMPSLSRGLDFVGVREYREGDSLRDLHHKAFARYGRPFTKEFETERGSGAVLVLDLNARSLRERYLAESLIKLAAGVGLWLLERGALGRFFVGNDEISLVQSDGGESFMDALARIPRNEVARWMKGAKSPEAQKTEHWSPAARPMGPVLRLGLYVAEEPLVHKQIVLATNGGSVGAVAESHRDDVLLVGLEKLQGTEVSL